MGVRRSVQALPENGKHLTLAELRAFVTSTADLPSDLPVKGHTGGGRWTDARGLYVKDISVAPPRGHAVNDQRTRKNLRDHDRAITVALETVSDLITDAYRHGTENTDSPWGSDPDPTVLQVAQIGASQAIALSIRSLTAHVIVGLADIADEIHRQARTEQPAPARPFIDIKHFAPYGAASAIDGTPVPEPTTWVPATGEYGDAEPFTVRRDLTTCPTCLHELLDASARRSTEETDR